MTLNIILGFLVLLISGALVWMVTRYDKLLGEKEQTIRGLQDRLAGSYSAKCCGCGKPYEPLNDPDFWPELNLCRDCLWKVHYEHTFGKEDKL